MAHRWFVDHLDHDLHTVRFTVAPEGLHFVNRINDAPDIDFQISRGAETIDGNPAWEYILGSEPSGIGPYRSGYRLRRDNHVVQEGLITAVDGAYGAEFMTVAGKGYAHYLSKRYFPFDPRQDHHEDFVIDTAMTGIAYNAINTDIATILTKLLDKLMLVDNTLPITYSLDPTGITIDYRLDLGDSTDFLSIIQTLSNEEPGFDWEVNSSRVLRIYSPKKYGIPTAVVANPEIYCVWIVDDTDEELSPDNVGMLNCTFRNTGPAGNHILALGSGTSTQVGKAIGFVDSQEVYWRLDEVKNYGNITSPGLLAKLAQAELSLGSQPVHDIQVIVDASKVENFWTTVHHGLAIYIKLDLGWHRIDSPHQILELDCTVNTEGDEIVTLNSNQIYDTSGLTGTVQG